MCEWLSYDSSGPLNHLHCSIGTLLLSCLLQLSGRVCRLVHLWASCTQVGPSFLTSEPNNLRILLCMRMVWHNIETKAGSALSLQLVA